MAKLIRVANDVSVEQPKDGWEETYKRLHPLLSDIPQIRTGAVDHEQGTKWLALACQLHSKHVVERLLDQQRGFTQEEARSLLASEYGEYNPKLAVSEVYALKNFEVVKVPDETDVDSKYARQIGLSMASSHYGVSASNVALVTQDAAAVKGGLPWLIAEPTMLNHIGESKVVLGLKFNYQKTLTQSDEIKLHYAMLALANQGIGTDQLLQINITMPEHYQQTLVEMSKLSMAAMKSAVALATELAAKNNSDIMIQSQNVPIDKALLSTIIESGNKHWQNILKGRSPEVRSEQSATLEGSARQQYIDLAKQYTSARLLKEYAERQFQKSRAELTVFAQAQPAIKTSPYELVHARSQETFDMSSAVSQIEARNISPDFYSKPTFDVEALVTAAQKQGLDTDQFIIERIPNRAQVETTLTQLGLNPDQFKGKAVHVHFSGQSRGAVKEKIDSATELVQEEVDALLKQLNTHYVLDAPTLSNQRPFPARSLDRSM